MSTVILDKPAEQVFSKPTRRRTTRQQSAPTSEEQPAPAPVNDVAPTNNANSTGKRTARRARIEVTNTEEKPTTTTTTGKRTTRRKPVEEQTDEQPAPAKKTTRRTVIKKKEKEEDKQSRILQLLDDIQALRGDRTLDVNARKKLNKELVAYENEYDNRHILDSLTDVFEQMFSIVWSTTKKKPVVLDSDVKSFLSAVEWGTAYSKANTKGKVQFTTHEDSLGTLLYSVNNGVANTVILNQLAKLYILLNPDINVPLPEGEKRTPQSFIKADDLMNQYLAGIMDELAQADEDYNAKIDEKGSNKKHKAVFNPENIPRQQVSKILQYNSRDFTGENVEEVLDGLKNDEKLLADTIQYHERQKTAKAKADKDSAPQENADDAEDEAEE